MDYVQKMIGQGIGSIPSSSSSIGSVSSSYNSGDIQSMLSGLVGAEERREFNNDHELLRHGQQNAAIN